jgi:hypothetical protein
MGNQSINRGNLCRNRVPTLKLLVK